MLSNILFINLQKIQRFIKLENITKYIYFLKLTKLKKKIFNFIKIRKKNHKIYFSIFYFLDYLLSFLKSLIFTLQEI